MFSSGSVISLLKCPVMPAELIFEKQCFLRSFSPMLKFFSVYY